MLNFSSHLQWFQAKIGSYDKQIWETSVEQRILQGLENRPKREGSLHKELIDIDLVRGSAFSKAKPRHGLKSVIFNGLRKVIFFPYYFTQWQDHFNKEVVYFFMFHYVIQLIQLALYFMWSSSSEIMLEEILLPVVLALSLGVLHAHIIDPYTVKQRRKKTYNSANSKSKPASKADSKSTVLTTVSKLHAAQNVATSQSVDCAVLGPKDACTCDLSQASQDHPASSRSLKKSVFFTQSAHLSDEISDEELANIDAEKVHPEGYDGETETKDSSSSSEREDNVSKSADEGPEQGEVTETASVETVWSRSSPKVPHRRVNVADNVRRFGEAEVVPVTDEEDLKKFITAKNKHIPDPTPVNIAKKDKDKSHCKMAGGLVQKTKKTRRTFLEVVGNTVSLSSGRVSSSLERSEDTTCAVTESTLPEVLDDTGDHAAPPRVAANQDAITDDSNSDQKSYNSALEAQTIIQGLSTTPERRSSHSVSQPHTPIYHEGSKYRHPIEVRMIASADASPTPSRKSSSLFALSNSLNGDLQQKPLEQSQLAAPSVMHAEACCGLTMAVRNMKGSVRAVDLNEDTITKSHKKREEYKQLFVKKAQASLVEKSTNYSSAKLKRRHREDCKLVSGDNFQKSKQRKEMVQSLSETEYDRMNSDVNSTGNSTSDDEEICPSVVASKAQMEEQQLCDKKGEEYEEHKIADLGDSVSQNNSSTLPEELHRPAHNGEASYPGLTLDDPFIMWYKEAHAPGSLQGMTGSVSCYIWEGEELKKTNLSLLDIGWSIIQAVERHEQDKIYSTLGFLVVLLLCFTPLFFRAYANRVSLAGVLEMTRPSLLPGGSFLHSLIEAVSANISQAVTPLVNSSSPQQAASLARDMVSLLLCSLLASDWPVTLMIVLGILLRVALYTMTFLMLCVAENSFEQRLQYAKHFCRLTSSRRARKYHLPHFRLNKLANIKCWLSLRCYLRKSGPQRSVESIISSAFYMLLAMLSLLCVNLLQGTDHLFINRLINWDLTLCSVALGIFMMRFLVLGTKITKKYRNLSVIITEQINLFLAMQTRPHKKEELTLAHNVLRLAEGLLKEVEGPFRICGWSMNPFLYNILKVVILSVFSTVLSETCGFKMKLYKIKINPANW